MTRAACMPACRACTPAGCGWWWTWAPGRPWLMAGPRSQGDQELGAVAVGGFRRKTTVRDAAGPALPWKVSISRQTQTEEKICLSCLKSIRLRARTTVVYFYNLKKYLSHIRQPILKSFLEVLTSLYEILLSLSPPSSDGGGDYGTIEKV